MDSGFYIFSLITDQLRMENSAHFVAKRGTSICFVERFHSNCSHSRAKEATLMTPEQMMLKLVNTQLKVKI